MCNIFVVDDDAVAQFIYEKNLTRYSDFKKISYYDNGGQLIDFLKENRDDQKKLPDVIILDLYMPVINGWKVLEAMQKIYSSLCKHITVYVVTASITHSDQLKAVSYSFVKEFISKPLSREKYGSISSAAKYAVMAGA